jgi:hypothetical protein
MLYNPIQREIVLFGGQFVLYDSTLLYQGAIYYDDVYSFSLNTRTSIYVTTNQVGAFEIRFLPFRTGLWTLRVSNGHFNLSGSSSSGPLPRTGMNFNYVVMPNVCRRIPSPIFSVFFSFYPTNHNFSGHCWVGVFAGPIVWFAGRRIWCCLLEGPRGKCYFQNPRLIILVS